MFIEALTSSPFDCSGFDLVLTWDPSQLVFSSAAAATTNWPINGFLFENGTGQINDLTNDGAHMFSLRTADAPVPVDGALTVARFSFQPLVDGAVALDQIVDGLRTRALESTPSVDATGFVGVPVLLQPTAPSSSVQTVRLGTPPNPNALRIGQTSGPVTGQTYDPWIDHTTFAPDAIVDVLGLSLAPTNLGLFDYTLLISVPVANAFQAPSVGAPFAIPIPDDCALVGATASLQGFSVLPNFALLGTNALDITIGNL